MINHVYTWQDRMYCIHLLTAFTMNSVDFLFMYSTASLVKGNNKQFFKIIQK